MIILRIAEYIGYQLLTVFGIILLSSMAIIVGYLVFKLDDEA